MIGTRRWTWTGTGLVFVMLVAVVSWRVGGSPAALRRSSPGSGLVLNLVGGDGGGGSEESDTLALPLALVSQTRVAVL